MDYVLIIAFDLGYGQLLVLDVSLSVLLSMTRNCEIALCTLMSEINDGDDFFTISDHTVKLQNWPRSGRVAMHHLVKCVCFKKSFSQNLLEHT